MNNPLVLKDPLGSIVNAVNNSDKPNIIGSVESNYEKYVAFDINNNVTFNADPGVIEGIVKEKPESNMARLVALANADETVYVEGKGESANENNYMVAEVGLRLTHTYKFAAYGEYYGTNSYELASAGGLYLANNTNFYPHSTDGKNHAYYDKNNNKFERHKFTAHELFLHAYYGIVLKADDFGHGNMDLNKDEDRVQKNANK